MSPVAVVFFIVLIGVAVVVIYRMSTSRKRTLEAARKVEFPAAWRTTLEEEVRFYRQLSAEDKAQLEEDIQEFLATTKITAISTSVDDVDRVLIAASAAIPVFGFPGWQYDFVHEVIVYPSHFNQNHETGDKDARILGMVGNGYMEGVVILSKTALRHGFSNETDKHNTAIHEFVHILDKQDGIIDGVPEILMGHAYTVPWMELMHRKMEEIIDSESDIRAYGATNRQEFFAAASEYFFERPKLLKSKHPELYTMLNQIFRQHPASAPPKGQ